MKPVRLRDSCPDTELPRLELTRGIESLQRSPV